MPFIPPMLATRLEDPRRLADPRYTGKATPAKAHQKRPADHQQGYEREGDGEAEEEVAGPRSASTHRFS
jgi:hypothetical protein